MENLITYTLFGSTIWFAILLFVLVAACIFSEHEEEGWIAALWLIIAFFSNYYWGTFPLSSIFTFRNIGSWLMVGFIFSMVRTYFKGRELTQEQKKDFDLKGHVFRWWLNWPFSLIYWLFKSLIRDGFNVVYSKLEKLYQNLFNI